LEIDINIKTNWNKRHRILIATYISLNNSYIFHSFNFFFSG
jgi:hypothetical protein